MDNKAHILIVDDDPITRDTLEGLLFPEGYEITFASSGAETIRLAKTSKPDTILLDVIMPDMDGFEVCRHLKTDERLRHIPIILVTGLNSKEDISRGLDAGAEEFLHKPVNGMELRARVRSMLRIKRQFDELEETVQLREDFSNMVVHDMKNPLSAVLMASQILEMKAKDQSTSRFINTIQTQTRRLESIMNDMLTLAKMKEGRLVLKRTNVDINQFVKEVSAHFDIMGKSRGIEIVTILPEWSRSILIDVNLFQRMLDNLLSNALKFSPNDSKITLQVECADIKAGTAPQQPQGLRIKVMDQGFGIPEDHRVDIFDKYKIVDLKKNGVPQFGLGLAFCKMVIEAHGGRIFVASNQPKGSVFTVEI